MFAKLIPTEVKFFDIFNAHAKKIVLASQQLQILLNDLSNIELHKKQIQLLEKEGDRITRDALEVLRKTFITPLDRDEIHTLIGTMDDILDLIEDVTITIYSYDVKELTPQANELCEIVAKAVLSVEQGVNLLHDMGQSGKILQACDDIDRYESEADQVLRSAISKLFREEHDVKNLIKLKEVYGLLELITDKCEDVANILEGIVLENG